MLARYQQSKLTASAVIPTNVRLATIFLALLDVHQNFAYTREQKKQKVIP